jgi:hypothetical protein
MNVDNTGDVLRSIWEDLNNPRLSEPVYVVIKTAH